MSDSKERNPLSGLLFIVSGIAVLWFFITVFDVSVPTASGTRVNNIGLMEDRKIGVAAGCVLLVLGVLVRYR